MTQGLEDFLMTQGLEDFLSWYCKRSNIIVSFQAHYDDIITNFVRQFYYAIQFAINSLLSSFQEGLMFTLLTLYGRLRNKLTS